MHKTGQLHWSAEFSELRSQMKAGACELIQVDSRREEDEPSISRTITSEPDHRAAGRSDPVHVPWAFQAG
jgi:hypothetical protein